MAILRGNLPSGTIPQAPPEFETVEAFIARGGSITKVSSGNYTKTERAEANDWSLESLGLARGTVMAPQTSPPGVPVFPTNPRARRSGF